MRLSRRIRVTGRVQGVFFRAWTRDQARRLGVNGWVRNCADGSVEAYAEGEGQAVSALIDAMRDGPSGAHVENLSFDEAEPADFASFEVRH